MSVVLENVNDVVVEGDTSYSVLNSKKLTRKVLHDAEVTLRTKGELSLVHKEEPNNKVTFVLGENRRVVEKVDTTLNEGGNVVEVSSEMNKSITHVVNMLVYNLIGEGYTLYIPDEVV